MIQKLVVQLYFRELTLYTTFVNHVRKKDVVIDFFVRCLQENIIKYNDILYKCFTRFVTINIYYNI